MTTPREKPKVTVIDGTKRRHGIGAGGTPSSDEKWFFPGRWLVQGTFFAVAALGVRALWNAVTSDSGDGGDGDDQPPTNNHAGGDAG